MYAMAGLQTFVVVSVFALLFYYNFRVMFPSEIHLEKERRRVQDVSKNKENFLSTVSVCDPCADV
jgi:hypothetical protein